MKKELKVIFPEIMELEVYVIDNIEYYYGKAVAKLLGLIDQSKAIRDHVSLKNKIKSDNKLFGQRGGIIINTFGVYELIDRTKLKKAKSLKEILPEKVFIEDMEEFISAGNFSNSLTAGQKMFISEILVKKNHIIKELKESIESLERKAEYYNKFVERNVLFNITTTADQIDIKPRKFVKLLIDNAFCFRNGEKQLECYTKYNNDLFAKKDYRSPKSSHSGSQLLITPLGKAFFNEHFKNYKTIKGDK